MNDVITAGRLNTLISCPRKHFWAFEIGLRLTERPSLALRFGSAWANAMEARWQGKTYEEALAIGIPEGIDLDAYMCETFAALLAGYYDYYGKRETAGKIHPEVQFESKLEGTNFSCMGKMDGLGTLKSGQSALIEAKTTGSGIEADSEYWMRLRFNIQVLNYIVEARKLGWDIAKAIYDVTRKPQIKPSTIADLDGDGKKIVIDSEGTRIYKKKKANAIIGKGKKAKEQVIEINDLYNPRQSGDESKGWIVKQHTETPAEFADRLWKDINERPAFYFHRREIPIIEAEVEDFIRQRLEMASLIEHYRHREDADFECHQRDPQAWPRHVSLETCNWCDFKSFCLQNISVDINNPPQGYSIQPFNPELQQPTEEQPKEP